jgi:hypothetical protein
VTFLSFQALVTPAASAKPSGSAEASALGGAVTPLVSLAVGEVLFASDDAEGVVAGGELTLAVYGEVSGPDAAKSPLGAALLEARADRDLVAVYRDSFGGAEWTASVIRLTSDAVQKLPQRCDFDAKLTSVFRALGEPPSTEGLLELRRLVENGGYVDGPAEVVERCKLVYTALTNPNSVTTIDADAPNSRPTPSSFSRSKTASGQAPAKQAGQSTSPTI